MTLPLNLFGVVFISYTLLLSAINLIVFAWLFIRSPQHRWPVVLMAVSQISIRFILLGKDPSFTAQVINIPTFTIPFLAYAIALFGFRIFDPIPLARQMALDQLYAGMIILDPQQRVVSLNPAAESILNRSSSRAVGVLVADLLPVLPIDSLGKEIGVEFEFPCPRGEKQLVYALTSSPLKDWRGLEVGYLLLLRDVTEQKHASNQIIEQQRGLAMLKEREQLARELHDNLGQAFAFISAQGQAARRQLDRGDTATADAYLERLVNVAHEADIDIRESILGLRVSLSEQALFPVLEQYLARYEKNYGIHIEMKRPDSLADDLFDPLVEVQLLRILQEAMTNVRKHAAANCVQILFSLAGGTAVVDIRDDGHGFNTRELHEHMSEHIGLRVMRERAEEVDGSLSISSRPGQGTTVTIQVPLREDYKEIM